MSHGDDIRMVCVCVGNGTVYGGNVGTSSVREGNVIQVVFSGRVCLVYGWALPHRDDVRMVVPYSDRGCIGISGRLCIRTSHL